MKRLLVCVDLTDLSADVLEHASKLALALGAEVWVLHVAAPEPDFVGYDVGPPAVRQQEARHLRSEHRETERLGERLREVGLKVTTLAVQGPTVDRILEHADRLGADLVVVGAHRHGIVHDLVVGSVARDLIRRSTRPIVVIPPPR